MLLTRYLLQFVEKAIDGAAIAYILILFANGSGAPAASTLAIVATCITAAGAYVIARASDRQDKTRILQGIEVIRGSLLLTLAFAGLSSVVLALAYCALLLFQALVVPIADSLAVQGLDEKRRIAFFARIYWVTNVAKLFGLVAGSLAIERGLFGWMLGGFAILSYVIAVMLSRQEVTSSAALGRGLVDRVSTNNRGFGPGFILLCIGYSGAWALVYLLTTYVGVQYATKFALGIVINWPAAVLDGVQLFYFVRLVGCLTAVLAQKPINFLFSPLSRQGSLCRIQAGAALFTVGMLAMTTADSAHVIFAAIAVYTIGEMLFVPYVRAYAVKIIPTDRRVEGLFFYGLVPMRMGQLLAAGTVLFVDSPLATAALVTGFGLLFACGSGASFILTRELTWTSQNTDSEMKIRVTLPRSRVL